MRKIFKITFLLLIITFIAIQFFRVKKNIATAPDDFKNDISAIHHVPQEVQLILQKSCYDCHSNQTKYPWYASIQPVSWWLANHIEDGKKELNFSTFASYRIRRQYRKLQEVIDEVEEENMPLKSYTWMHKNARLDKADKDMIINWANNILDSMKKTYPADSLIRKKS